VGCAALCCAVDRKKGGMEPEGHSNKFANAFASILADEQAEGPARKKLKKAPNDVVRKRLETRGMEAVHICSEWLTLCHRPCSS
jgi:hypothetical protein